MQAEAPAGFCGKVRGGFLSSAQAGIDDLLLEGAACPTTRGQYLFRPAHERLRSLSSLIAHDA